MFYASNILYDLADRTREIAAGGIGAIHLLARQIGLIDDIKKDLSSTLLRTGRDSLSEIVGADAATITAEDWPAT